MGVLQDIKAILHDSEDDPEETIAEALNAIAEFALLECEVTEEGWEVMTDDAWRAAEKKVEET